MSLIEQRTMYMQKLQSLIDGSQKIIDDKLAIKRAEFEQNVIAPMRADLDTHKVTPEMTKLVDFINQIDVMNAYENAQEVVESKEEVQHINTSVEDVANEVETTAQTFCATENEALSMYESINTMQNVNITSATQLIGTGFEAVAADIADTNEKLRMAAEQGRPGMSGIVLPRR